MAVQKSLETYWIHHVYIYIYIYSLVDNGLIDGESEKEREKEREKDRDKKEGTYDDGAKNYMESGNSDGK